MGLALLLSLANTFTGTFASDFEAESGDVDKEMQDAAQLLTHILTEVTTEGEDPGASRNASERSLATRAARHGVRSGFKQVSQSDGLEHLPNSGASSLQRGSSEEEEATLALRQSHKFAALVFSRCRTELTLRAGVEQLVDFLEERLADLAAPPPCPNHSTHSLVNGPAAAPPPPPPPPPPGTPAAERVVETVSAVLAAGASARDSTAGESENAVGRRYGAYGESATDRMDSLPEEDSDGSTTLHLTTDMSKAAPIAVLDEDKTRMFNFLPPSSRDTMDSSLSLGPQWNVSSEGTEVSVVSGKADATAQTTKKKRGASWRTKRIGGMFGIIVCFLVLGAVIFRTLEHANEKRVWRLEDEQRAAHNAQLDIIKVGLNHTDAATLEDLCGQPELGKRANKWDFTGSIFFSVTVITTIGYGNYAPVTTSGRAAVAVYGFLGIMLVAAAMSMVAEALVAMAIATYTRARDAHIKHQSELREKNWKKTREGQRKASIDFLEGTCGGVYKQGKVKVAPSPFSSGDIGLRRLVRKQRKIDMQHELDEEQAAIEEARRAMRVKDKRQLLFAALMVMAFTLLSALIIQQIEGWWFSESMYFCFVTMSTIGFGDFVPATHGGKLYTTFIIIFGLSTLNLCVNLASILLGSAVNQRLRADTNNVKRRAAQLASQIKKSAGQLKNKHSVQKNQFPTPSKAISTQPWRESSSQHSSGSSPRANTLSSTTG